MPTEHYKRVRAFMKGAKQKVRNTPGLPNGKTRVLRAKLIIEEALETVAALGVDCRVNLGDDCKYEVLMDRLEFNDLGEEHVSMKEVADGCADIHVVTTGTLVSFGIDDEALLQEVDESNLAKLGPGHSFRADGKLLKPKDWTPPRIVDLLISQKAIED